MLRLYKAFIHPHLEYAPRVWDPYLVKDIENLEKCQKFALRVCTRGWSVPYSDLLSSTPTSTLSDRCKAANLCHLYKIVHGLADCQSAPVVQKPITFSRCRNPTQLQQLSTHSSQFHISFYPHTISLWKMLIMTLY